MVFPRKTQSRSLSSPSSPSGYFFDLFEVKSPAVLEPLLAAAKMINVDTLSYEKRALPKTLWEVGMGRFAVEREK